MTTFGLTAAGFVPKTLNDIITSLQGKLRALIGNSLDFSDSSPNQQLIGVIAGELADPWEAAELIWSSLSPDNSSGASLVDVSAITGTLPLGAQSSVVTETLVGTSTTVVPAGTIISVQGRSNTRFDTDSAVTLAAASAWTTSATVALGTRLKANGSVYQATQGGITASSGSGPSGTASAITDGTVVWRFLGAGDGSADVSMSSEVLDAITAPSGTLTRIESPVSGLNAAVNLLDAQVGRPIETDPELRTRREQDLRSEGSGNTDAISAHVANVPGVVSVSTFENDTDFADGDGLPPHSINVVVGLNAGPPANVNDLIRQAIFEAKDAGTQTEGAITGTVVDATGTTREIDFDYLTPVPAYIRLDLQVTSAWPADGDNQVVLGILALEGTLLTGGYDLTAARLIGVAATIPGFFDAPNVQVGPTSPASGTKVTAGKRQFVTVDTSRILVSHTVVTP